ncbi:hypothetical protein, partial [Parazoarcus communis]|uniref:hypothetical protein n=1 Tax=Parazoarcus communis TaxID=41977 RepID=UPI0014596C85
AANIPKSPIPATDQQIEDAIYVELVARGMGSDLARRLIEAGYCPTTSLEKQVDLSSSWEQSRKRDVEHHQFFSKMQEGWRHRR